jgi:hypothetical protein
MTFAREVEKDIEHWRGVLPPGLSFDPFDVDGQDGPKKNALASKWTGNLAWL